MTNGTVRILLLRVDFQPDTDPQTTGTGEWNDCTTGCKGDPDYWVNNSVQKFTDYLSEVSYGQLTVQITISPNVYTLSHVMGYYGDNELSTSSFADIENLIYDSVKAADADINFSTYDAILIVHAGAGQESDVANNNNGDTPNDIWSLYYANSCVSAGATGSNCLIADGVDVNEAIIMPQTDSQDGITVNPVGVYLHEFGHWLGLPDLYCTALICLTDGVGDWSLMDSGTYNYDPALCPNTNNCEYGSSPAHLDAWSKTYLGWATPVEYASDPDPGSVSLNPVEPGPEIIKLQASTENVNQYFLLENRRKTGFDVGLPGEGMLVWLIDDEIISSKFFSNTINNDRNRPGVKLIEADGTFDLLDGNPADLGTNRDPFPGTTNNTLLTPQSAPSTIPYTPYGWINLRNIATNGNAIDLSIGFSPFPPQGVSVTVETVNWIASSEPDLSLYRVYRNGSLITETTETSYTDPAFNSDAVYQVSAVDVNGNESLMETGGQGSGAPHITYSPTELSYGEVVIGEPKSLTVTITNNGTGGDLVISGISLTGTYASDFSYTDTCPEILADHNSCTVAVAFSPQSSGAKGATLEISTNDPVQAIAHVTLDGIGISPASGGKDFEACFIATAAYGSYMAEDVVVLRRFRDDVLLQNALGRQFVRLYYRFSPPVAAVIARHNILRAGTRIMLIPLVYSVKYPLTAGIMVLLCGAGAVYIRRKRSM